MKKVLKPLAFSIGLALLSPNVFAETEVATSVEAAEVSVTVEDLKDQWMEDYGNYLIENSIAEVYFGHNISTSTKTTMSVLETAYNRAVVNALEEAAKQEELKGTSEALSVLLDDQPEFAENLCTKDGKTPPSGLAEQIKEVSLLWVKEKLVESGLDESSVEEAMEIKKHEESLTAFEDFYKSNSKTSTGNVSKRGFVTADTFTQVNSDGSVEVGVILIKFAGVEDMLDEMFNNPNKFDANSWDFRRLNIRDITDAENGPVAGMSFETIHDYAKYSIDNGAMGTDLVLNSHGYPTFISYSYKSQKKSGNKVKDRKYAKSAKAKAITKADAELLKTLDLTVKVTSEITNIERYAELAIAEYAGCEFVPGTEYSDTEIDFDQGIKTTVEIKSRSKQKIKGTKRKSGSYVNPYNENDSAFYAYTYWSPFDSISQSKYKTTTVKKKGEVEVTPESNKKGSSQQEAKSSSKFRMDF